MLIMKNLYISFPRFFPGNRHYRHKMENSENIIVYLTFPKITRVKKRLIFDDCFFLTHFLKQNDYKSEILKEPLCLHQTGPAKNV